MSIFIGNNRTIEQIDLNRHNTVTDYWRIDAMIQEIKMSQLRLRKLLHQFDMMEKSYEMHSLPHCFRSILIQHINREATNLIINWELMKETANHLFAENDIENDFAKDIKNIREDMNGILQKIDMVTA